MFVVSFCSIIALSSCSNGSTASAISDSTIPITVNKVDLINESDLSVYVHITPKNDITNWKFGFYAPYNFNKLNQLNKSLTLQI